MDISFLVFERVEELDLVGPWELVGLLSDRKLCSRPRLVTLNGLTPAGAHGMRFVADAHYAQAPPADVLFVPGGAGGRLAMEDRDAVAWLGEQGRRGATVLSICTGSFLMQRAGLLKGRRATSHWAFLDHLRRDPDVAVVEQRFVHDGSIWTAGGVSAGMDMTLAWIASTFGEAVAAEVQLEAEYFPDGTIYGRPQERADVSAYIRRLSRHAAQPPGAGAATRG